MSETIPDYLLSAVSDAVATELGLHFPRDRWPDLARALAKAAPTLGFKDGQSCANSLLQLSYGEKRIEALAGYLTIGETHFFRDEKLFNILEFELLPEIVASRKDMDRRLRIWSAGCATGEEPYTVAMVPEPDVCGLAGMECHHSWHRHQQRFPAKGIRRRVRPMVVQVGF